jgi:class 3 adenylate cyclase
VSCAAYTLFVLHFSGVVKVSAITSNAQIFGSLWEVTFLTIAVIDKIYVLRKEKSIVEKEKLELIESQNRVLEEKVKERTSQLETEKKKSDDLLLNILPADIADEIKTSGKSRAKTYSMVTVMFTDFKSFTEISQSVSAELLVSEIDYCFSAFDVIVQKYNLEKIKTVGDAYLCAGGLPNLSFTHGLDAVNAAIEIRDFMLSRKREKQSRGEIPFEIRIGLHTGSVVAGVVGVKKFAYDIWGDTVNLAARMEQNSEPGKINISGTTYNLVKDSFSCEYRGKIHAKNKGEVDMYFIEKKIPIEPITAAAEAIIV